MRRTNALLACWVWLGAAACWTAPPDPLFDAAYVRAQGEDIGWRLTDFGHELNELAPQMCAELGRPVPPAAPAYRATTPAERSRSCEAGAPGACAMIAWELATGSFVDADGHPQHRAPDANAAIALYRQSCGAGLDNSCLSLSDELRKSHDVAARVALVDQLIAAGRVELAGELWTGFDDAERAQFAPRFDALRESLERRCHSANGEACLRRGGLERDPTRKHETPWFVRACFGGSMLGCGFAASIVIDPRASQDTIATLRRACPGGECHDVIGALAASCKTGSWSSCYMLSNACHAGPQS